MGRVEAALLHAGRSKRMRSQKRNCWNHVVVRVMHAVAGNAQELTSTRHGVYNGCKRSVAG